MILGCGQPAGEAGYNIARVVAVLAGLADVPGVTVNRYCSSSLQTIRMAAHAIKAGEGDVFVAAGVETVSRYGAGASRHRPERPSSPTPRRARPSGARRAAGRGRRRPGCPTSTSPWARPPRTSPSTRRRHPRGDGRVRRRSQHRAVASVENGFFDREITPVTLPDGTVVSKDDGPRAGTTVEKLAELKPVFRPDGTGHRRQRLPAQRRRRRGARDERHQGRASSGITPLARIVSSGRHRPQPRDHGPRPDRGVPPGAGAGPA